MNRALKWIASIVGIVLLLIVAGEGYVYALTETRMNAAYPTSAEMVRVPSDAVSIAHGRHFVEAIGKCQACHGDNYAGMDFLNAKGFGHLTSRNLTSGRGGIGSTFTDVDWVRALRHGVGRDGKTLYMMPAFAYYNLNDTDLGAMIAYLKTLPPADENVPPARTIGPMARTLSLLTSFPLLSAPEIPAGVARPEVVLPGVTKAYGEYLSKTGGCTSCHGASVSGGDPVEGVKAANLTPGGEVGKWTEADFVKAIRTGIRPNNSIISAVMPWKYAKNMTDDEIAATWEYIHSLPAKKLGEK